MKADRRWWNDGRFEREGDSWYRCTFERPRRSVALVVSRDGVRLLPFVSMPADPPPNLKGMF